MFLKMNSLFMKVLIILDNAPGQPPNLYDEILEKFKFIKVFTCHRTPPLSWSLWTSKWFPVLRNDIASICFVGALILPIIQTWAFISGRTTSILWIAPVSLMWTGRMWWGGPRIQHGGSCGLIASEFENFATDESEIQEIMSLSNSLGLEMPKAIQMPEKSLRSERKHQKLSHERSVI